MRHAPGVLTGAKDGKAIFGGAESFDSFVRLLAIVQAGRHSVDREIRGADESWSCPFRGLNAVMGLDMAVHFGNRVNQEFF